MKKQSLVAKFAKPIIGLTLGGVGGLLLLLNASYAAVGQNPALQIFGMCTGLFFCMIAPVFIIPAPHDE